MHANEVIALNRRGEGVAADGRAIPGALPGDIVGEPPIAARAAPICGYYGACGGCAAQHMPAAVYADWKRAAVVEALASAGVRAEVAKLVDAHGAGRRRATFHARAYPDGRVEVGFMRARAHEIVDIDACPLFAPELAPAPAVAHALALALRNLGKPLDIQATATETGLDVDVRGSGPLPAAETRKLLALAETLDLARLSLHGVKLVERRPPRVAFGAIAATPPPGGFLQATAAGEAALADLAADALKGARRVADLFCGSGAFALRLAGAHSVYAVDSDVDAVAAVRRAAMDANLRGVEAARRDLYKAPLPAAELSRFDAVLSIPPRSGALAQVGQIAASGVTNVVAISCNAESFARDARILQDAGFVAHLVTPIDQFRYSPHVELFAGFRRQKSDAAAEFSGERSL